MSTVEHSARDEARDDVTSATWRSISDTATFSEGEQRRRWTLLQRRLRERQVSAALFSQSRNVLYFAGISAHGHVLIPAEGSPAFLVQIDVERAERLTAIPEVVPSRGLKTLVDVLLDRDLGKEVIGIEKDSVPVGTFERLAQRLPQATWVDVGADVLEQRMIKSAEEIACLSAAARISDDLIREFRSAARPGTSEIELYGHLARLQRLLGADGLSSKHGFNDRTIEHGWLVSGPNTAQVSGYWLTMTGLGPSPARPYGPTGRVIDSGDLVCYDVGTSYRGYHSDHARTVTMGPAAQRQRQLWEALLQMQRQAIAAAVPGGLASDIYSAAEGAAQELGLLDVFMTRAVHDFRYVGHGVGLEIDEPPLLGPRNSTVLEEGMVLAIEPKVIVPHWGGLTVEDTVLVTSSGPRLLTTASTDLEVTV